MPTLSLALICRDEAANLGPWLERAAPLADEVVAVDSGSSDATMAILEAAGVRVYQRDWTGYADQRNFTAEQCRGDWILFLDADEYPDAEMAAALGALRQGSEPAEAVLAINRKVFFCGRFLRHGGFYPEWVYRLYRRGAARWEPREVHERLAFTGRAGRLPGHAEHYSYQSVLDYLARMERYADLAARQMLKDGRRTRPLGAWSHAAWAFAARYLLRQGFRDGWPGYLAARLEALYTLTKYARLMELRHKEEGS